MKDWLTWLIFVHLDIFHSLLMILHLEPCMRDNQVHILINGACNIEPIKTKIQEVKNKTRWSKDGSYV